MSLQDICGGGTADAPPAGRPGTGSAAATGWALQSTSAHNKDRLDMVARASIGRQAAHSHNMLSQSLDKGKRNDTF